MLPRRFADSGVISDWTRFHALADAQTTALRDALYRALTGLVDALDLDVLADAIREGSISVAGGTLDLDGFEVMLGDALRRSLRGVLLKSGDTALAQLSGAPTLADSAQVALLGRFNMTDPDALAWIDGETGKLVRAITREQRELLVDAVHNTFGIRARTPDTLAREIRGMIGLTPHQRSYVSRYRQRLTQQVASGDLKLRAGWVDTLTERYQRNWLKYRSQTIAQTETIAASSAGRDLAWSRGVASGLIDTAQMEQVWIVTNSPTTCPECRPLNGARAPIGGTFPGGHIGPPLHPRCRCAKALIRVGTAMGKFEQDLPDYAPRSLQMQPTIPQRALR